MYQRAHNASDARGASATWHPRTLPTPRSRLGLVGARRSRISGARFGFTLVELLVVIGIIALLIAILLPALARVRTQAKATQTAGLLKAIENGLQTFQADFGYYPDSRNPRGRVRRWDPITDWPNLGGQPVRQDTGGTHGLTGAHWLARALAGHDLSGVDAQGAMLGRLTAQGETPPAIPYDHFLEQGPHATRRSVYIEADTLVMDDDTTKFQTSKTGTPFLPRRRLLVYDASFGSPVLYYRANPQAQYPFCRTGFGNDRMGSPSGDMAGIYTHQDNTWITGDDQGSDSSEGWDFTGAGGTHRIATFGVAVGDVLKITDRESFVDFLRNPDAPGQAKDAAGNTISITPHNPGTFILLTAGPDGLFGTRDDIGNFPIRK